MDLVKFATQSQMQLNQAETVELILPAGCPLGTPATGWTRHVDGKITARYTRDELLAALVAVGWLETGADCFSLQGLAIYARLRIGEHLIASGVDPAQEFKLQSHWCQLYAELAQAEPDLVGAGRGPGYWRQYAQELAQ